MAPVAQLALFSASKLSTPIWGGHVACNPAIDLTATVGDASNILFVWRANDQLVSKHTERNQKASAVRWKEDGTALFSLRCAVALTFCYRTIPGRWMERWCCEAHRLGEQQGGASHPSLRAWGRQD